MISNFASSFPGHNLLPAPNGINSVAFGLKFYKGKSIK